MSLIRFFNDRVKRLNIFDLKLVQACAMLLAVIIVKFVPEILAISIWWFVALLLVLVVRPAYVFFFRQ